MYLGSRPDTVRLHRLGLAPPRTKLRAILSSVELDEDQIVLRFNPRAGHPAEIEDRVTLAPRLEMMTVYGIGRLLRLMRAARIKPPPDPYSLAVDRQRALDLMHRCLGTEVRLHVDRRLERVLTLWTDSGIERLGGLLDYTETPDYLSVTRRGARSVLHIAKRDLIRFEAATQTEYVIVSVESH